MHARSTIDVTRAATAMPGAAARRGSRLPRPCASASPARSGRAAVRLRLASTRARAPRSLAYARPSFPPGRPVLEAALRSDAAHLRGLHLRQHGHRHLDARLAGAAAAARRVPGFRAPGAHLPARPGPAGALCQRLHSDQARRRAWRAAGRRRLARLDLGVGAGGRLGGLRSHQRPHARATSTSPSPMAATTTTSARSAASCSAAAARRWPSRSTSAWRASVAIAIGTLEA